MAKQRRGGNRPAKPGIVGAEKMAAMTTDSFANTAARVGWGTENQQSGSGYTLTYQTKQRISLEAAYRGSWIVAKAVDAVAEDMTRAGVEIAGLEPDQVTMIERALTRMQVWDKLCDAIKWSRLYGGAIAVMLIDGQDLSTPLRVEGIGQGQFKGLLVLDRWMVSPPVGDVITEFGPEMGRPANYQVLAVTCGLPSGNIHHSRCIRLEGCDLPHFQRMTENGWGLSILEPMWDRLVAFDSATNGAGQLTYKAHLRVMKVPNLRDIVAQGGQALKGLEAQLKFMRLSQTNEGLTVIDAADDFQAHQYSFSGLSDVLMQFAQQLSGATGIPLTRLFGQSPAGLNATGEGDMEAYHDSILHNQERRLRTGLHNLLSVIAMSELGQALPDDFGFEFRNLQQMSEAEKSGIATATVDAVTKAVESGLIDRAQGMRELKAAAPNTGMFGDISQESIDSAEQQEPPTPDLTDMGAPDEQAPSGSLFERVLARARKVLH